MTAAAVKSFHLFGNVLRDAVAGCRPRDGLRANALAYVRFVRERPGRYQLMSGSPLLGKAAPDSEIAAAAQACFNPLLSVLRAAARDRESVRDAVGVWASLHGIAQLERFHPLSGLRTKNLRIDIIVDDLFHLSNRTARVGKPRQPHQGSR